MNTLLGLTLSQWVTIIFWLAAATLLFGLARRVGLWRQGKAAPIAWSGLLAMPKRYFVDLHDVVAREPFVARAHVLTAGGVILAMLVVALNYGLGLYLTWLNLVLLLAALMSLVGSLLMVWRRHAGKRPERLSVGAWNRLPISLFVFALAILGVSISVIFYQDAVAAGVAFLLVALLLWGSAELALGIGMGGPMKHAVTGLLHLAFHPRPERFSEVKKSSATALRTLDIQANDFGIAKPADFVWNRLLAFDACVQCGKCEAACPAYAAGQPLNPKKLIQDLVTGMVGGSDANYTGNPYPSQIIGQHSGDAQSAIVPKLIDAETLWSCTTCRACVQACPMLIEHVDAVVDIRRHLTMVEGQVPNKGAEVLQQLRETDTQGGFSLAARHHWAIDLDVPVLNVGQSCDYLLIVGEGGFDMRYQRTLRALVKTLKKAGLDIAVLGTAETDCGDLARRLGDEFDFQRLANQFMDTLAQRHFKTIVTPDPHIFHCLKNEFPTLRVGFASHFDIIHHTQLLNQLLESKTLELVAGQIIPEAITYHDPCYLGRYNRETDAPRNVLKNIGIHVIEMERHGMQSRCCGGGGGAPFTDILGTARIPDIRMADAKDVAAKRVAVACPGCTTMLEGVTGVRPDVIDVAELVAQAVGAV